MLVKIGDCQRELGQYFLAEATFLQAAGYSYLNKTIEAAVLWLRLATNVLAWGDALYKEEDLPGLERRAVIVTGLHRERDAVAIAQLAGTAA